MRSDLDIRWHDLSDKFTQKGIRVAETVLTSMENKGLFEEPYPMYKQGVQTVVVLRDLPTSEDQASAQVLIESGARDNFDFEDVPWGSHGFGLAWNDVVKSKNPAIEMAKYLVETERDIFRIIILGFPAWVGRDFCSDQRLAKKLAEAANFSFLPEYREKLAMFYVMGGDIYDSLSSQRDNETGNLIWKQQSSGSGYRNRRMVYQFSAKGI